MEFFLVEESGRVITDETVYQRLSEKPKQVEFVLRQLALGADKVRIEGKRYHVWTGGVEYTIDPRKLPDLLATTASFPSVPWAPRRSEARDGGRGRRIYFANLPGTENEPVRGALRTLVGPSLNQGPVKGEGASTYLRALQVIETALPRLSSEELLQVRLQLHAMAEGHDSRTSHSYYPNEVHFRMVDLITSIKRLEAQSEARDGGEKQDLLGILFETIETWRQMAPHRAGDLRLQVLSGGMEVKTPRGTHISHLQYALSWLIENAIEFSNPGTEIRIFLIQQDQEAIIKIMDRGIGISEEWIPRVLGGKRDPRGFTQRPWRNIPDFGEFDPFAPGGLYAARRVIEGEYHGKLLLESEGEEKGTTVTVRIPLRSHSARDGGVKQLKPPSPRHLIPLYSP